MIKAAINGGRSKAEHKAVPVTPAEQAAAVTQCLAGGASAIHLHVRSLSNAGNPQSGKESLDADDVNETLAAVLAVVPKVLVGVSTGAWILPHPARLQAVAEWEVLPGFASVNFGEDGSVELAQLLLSRGVDIEAGLCDADAANRFLDSGLVDNCLRVLIEPQEQDMKRALETVNAIEELLESGARKLPRLLHGTEATAWPMMNEALTRGHDVRIGIEDTLVMPDGKIALDNAELVAEGVRRAQAVGMSNGQ